MKRNVWIVVALVVAVAAVVVLKQRRAAAPASSAGDPPAFAVRQAQPPTAPPPGGVPPATAEKALPRLVDLGAGECIPCKMMAPILEELKKEFDGRLVVEFIDVWKDPSASLQYGIKLIPTQIFLDAAGKELFRHEGFFSRDDILATWKEFGVDFGAAGPPPFSRWQPAQPDTRAKDTVCYLCDGDVDPRAKVVVKTAKGDVNLCSPHCYFIMYSCLTEDKTGFESKVTVTDGATGAAVPATSAVYLCGVDGKTGRPTIQAFADKAGAEAAQKVSGGSLLTLAALQAQELTNRCGFCDRAVYPQDVAEVIVADGVRTWGCCSHCALGVAARTGKDIEVRERDRLTGAAVVVKTLDGKVAALEPAPAVAWFGQRTKPDGSHASAGCFHQGFFVNADNLRTWVEGHPLETGEQITIQKALADKMKLAPEQIKKACKIGECAPK